MPMLKPMLCLLLIACAFAVHSWAQDRMPEIPADKLTPEQKKAVAEFEADRKAPLSGPFIPLLRSPELMMRAEALGKKLRYNNSLPPSLNEFAILITARFWTQEYEWATHYPLAIKAGLNPETAQALAEGRRPDKASEDELLVYDFCTELHRNHNVSDTTYARAVARFGEQGVMDMVGICGYYTLMAMTLNVDRTPLPAGAKPALPMFPH